MEDNAQEIGNPETAQTGGGDDTGGGTGGSAGTSSGSERPATGGSRRTGRGNPPDGGTTGRTVGIEQSPERTGDTGDNGGNDGSSAGDGGSDRGNTGRDDSGNADTGRDTTSGNPTGVSGSSEVQTERVPPLVDTPRKFEAVPTPKTVESKEPRTRRARPAAVDFEMPEDEKEKVARQRQRRSKGLAPDTIATILSGLFRAYASTKHPYLREAWQVDQDELSQAALHISLSLDALPAKYIKYAVDFANPCMAVVCMATVVNECQKNERMLQKHYADRFGSQQKTQPVNPANNGTPIPVSTGDSGQSQNGTPGTRPEPTGGNVDWSPHGGSRDKGF